MDSDTLHTASTYLNNLLLARGLLRNGKSLDFAKPTRDTRAQVINLVHDLLLRRDRDQENREQISLTLRTLRADETRKDAELEKYKSRLEEKERALLQAQTATRNMKMDMRRTEANTKALQDQLARLKISVNHIKTQCANDVRKRDLHVERLKSHLQGQQRGNKGGVIAPLMNATGGSGASSRSNFAYSASMRDLGDPEYSLKQETNEFLTQLGQSLSDENDGLIAMLKNTLQTMKDMLGLSPGTDDIDTTALSAGEGEHDISLAFDADAMPVSYDILAAEMESTLEVLGTVLTSPNFVSMEEVESRDEEIVRLREGWEMMEARWKEVLSMMNTWRNKLEKTGDTINLEDLKRGLGLGEGLDSSPLSKNNQLRHGHDQADTPNSRTLYTAKATDKASGRDSGIGRQTSSSPTRPRDGSREGLKKPANASLDPPELFAQKPAKDRHLRRMNPNVQSPRRVAFEIAKSSPSFYQTQDYDSHSSSDRSPVTAKALSERRSPGPPSSPQGRSADLRAHSVSIQ